MYGHKFTSQFGEYPDDTWIRCLIGLSQDQLSLGLRASMEVYTDWPPGAAQFRALCLGVDPRNIDDEGNDADWQHKRIEAADREFKAIGKITNKEAAKAARDKAIAEMRKINIIVL